MVAQRLNTLVTVGGTGFRKLLFFGVIVEETQDYCVIDELFPSL